MSLPTTQFDADATPQNGKLVHIISGIVANPTPDGWVIGGRNTYHVKNILSSYGGSWDNSRRVWTAKLGQSQFMNMKNEIQKEILRLIKENPGDRKKFADPIPTVTYCGNTDCPLGGACKDPDHQAFGE